MRKEIIEKKLDRIENMDRDEIKEYFSSEYEKHKNVHNLLVNWDAQRLTRQRMASIAYCMGGKLIVMFLRKLSMDFKNWCSGMPDLVLWREDKKMVKFAEVKSENDHLSEQ